jgi:hopanoid-associated phosphorylase
MRLGIAAGLSAELRPITARRIPIGEVIAVTDNILLVLSGIGERRARAAGRTLVRHGARALLSWGTAAALQPPLRPGDLLIPTTLIGPERRTREVDRAWHAQVCEQLAAQLPICSAPLAQTTTVLTDTQAKQALARDTGAVAADMESVALAGMAAESRLPFLAIRAVSDEVSATIPESLAAAVDASGRLSPAACLGEVVLRPWRWPALMRLARGLRAARNTLEQVFRGAGGHLPPQG